MTRPVTVKMADSDYVGMETIRDHKRFPTQSDFILLARWRFTASRQVSCVDRKEARWRRGSF